MFKRETVFSHPRGMHIRAAAMLVQKAYEIQHNYDANIYIRNEIGREAPATALMAIHSLNLKPGEQITILASGKNVPEAIDCFIELLQSDLLPRNAAELEKIDDILEENVITADQIFDSIGSGLIVVNDKGIITLCNKMAEELTGFERQYLIGKNVFEVIEGIDLKVFITKNTQRVMEKRVIGKKTVKLILNAMSTNEGIVGYSIILDEILEENPIYAEDSFCLPRVPVNVVRARKVGRPNSDGSFDGIIGISDKFIAALDVAAKAAATASTVMIRGESGTGKEIVAQAIHRAGPRADRAFIKVNCPAIPANLMESELFGHEKGSFTGALYQKVGKFELADGGSIFLDEIGELTPDMQAKILRVLQEREFERVGGNKTIKVDVRILSATHRDLEDMVARGKFREDLYYRLNVVPILLPCLKERREDIPYLAEHFLENLCKQLKKPKKHFSKEVMRYFYNYDWPGNVRELSNAIERALNLTEDDIIQVWDLPHHITGNTPNRHQSLINFDAEGEMADFSEYEKQIIKKALERHKSFNAAGKVLGITHKTVAAKARKYGIVD